MTRESEHTFALIFFLNLKELIIYFFRYKLVVADAIIEHLNPIQKKLKEYNQDEEYLLSVLREGNERAQETAETTMQEVRLKMGLIKDRIELVNFNSKKRQN